MLLSWFSYWLPLWQSLPPQTRLIVISAILTALVRLIRESAPRLDGRLVHGLVMVLTIGGVFLDTLSQGGLQNGYLSVLSEFCSGATAALAAIGINEVARKNAPKRKSGKSAKTRPAKPKKDGGDVT